MEKIVAGSPDDPYVVPYSRPLVACSRGARGEESSDEAPGFLSETPSHCQKIS